MYIYIYISLLERVKTNRFHSFQERKRVVFTRSRRENESFSLAQGEKTSRFHSFKERKRVVFSFSFLEQEARQRESEITRMALIRFRRIIGSRARYPLSGATRL